MMSDQVLEKLERVAGIAEKFNKAMDKLPRLLGMAGTGLFAGRASKRLGGDFATGAISGMVAHDLAHSQLPNNQIGGVALAVYLSAVGLLNVIPTVPFDIPPILELLDPSRNLETFIDALPFNEKVMSRADCIAEGGTVVMAFPLPGLGQNAILALVGADPVICRLDIVDPATDPSVAPQEGGPIARDPRPGRIRRNVPPTKRDRR